MYTVLEFNGKCRMGSLSLPFGLSFEHLYSETTAEPPFHRDPLHMCSVCFKFHCPWAVVFTRGEKVLFEFFCHWLRRLVKSRLPERGVYCYIFFEVGGYHLRTRFSRQKTLKLWCWNQWDVFNKNFFVYCNLHEGLPSSALQRDCAALQNIPYHFVKFLFYLMRALFGFSGTGSSVLLLIKMNHPRGGEVQRNRRRSKGQHNN